MVIQSEEGIKNAASRNTEGGTAKS